MPAGKRISRAGNGAHDLQGFHAWSTWRPPPRRRLPPTRAGLPPRHGGRAKVPSFKSGVQALHFRRKAG